MPLLKDADFAPRPVRFMITACICALLVFSYTLPAYSDPVNITGNRTAPQQGEAQLRSIEREAQEAVLKDPYSREETKAKVNQGLNEIQGAADIDKMSRPENSQDARAVEDKSKNFLEALTGKNSTDSKTVHRVPATSTDSKTAPQQGEAQLRSIEREAQEAVLKDPYSREETKAKANQGLNEIQGAADIDKMSRPENSQDARAVEDKSKNFLEALTGKK